jgi:hypothetical protein
LARILKVPLCFFYCEDDVMAELILSLHVLKKSELQQLMLGYRRD